MAWARIRPRLLERSPIPTYPPACSPQGNLLEPVEVILDWSVAKGGFLCAYRWDGEQELNAGKIVWTG